MSMSDLTLPNAPPVGDPADAGPDACVEIGPDSVGRGYGLPQAWAYRHLLKHFVLRELRARYRSTFFGFWWVLLQPLLLAAVYWLVFGVLLGVRADRIPIPLFIFSGVGIYLFFSGAVRQTAGSLAAHVGTFSKVYYPRLIAPLTSVSTGSFDLLAVLGICLLLMAAYGIAPGWGALAALPLLLAVVLLALGAGLLLAALSVERRDVQIALPVALRALLYASPVTYPASLIPERWQAVYYANPLAGLLQGFRWALMGDTPPPAGALAWSAAAIALLLWLGLRAFSRVESRLVDTL